MSNKALFLDLDHTLIRPKSGQTFPKDADDWEFMPGMLDAVRPYIDKGYLLMIISNQGGIEAGHHTHSEIFDKMRSVLAGVNEWYGHDDFIDAYGAADFVYCPHLAPDHPDRKPNIGMLLQAQQVYDIDFSQSLFVGDMQSDQQYAETAHVAYRDVKDFISEAQASNEVVSDSVS